MRTTSLRALLTLGVASALAACGGGDSPTGPSGSSLSVAEAQLVAANLFVEISKALSTATISKNVTANGPSLSTVPTTVNETVNSTCAAGGTIKGTYSFTTDFGASGAGTESGTVTVTSTGCKVSTGSRTIAVDGSYTLTFNVSFANAAQSTNYVWNETGNFTWDGGSCAINYNVTITPQGKETLSGSICGQTINYSN